MFRCHRGMVGCGCVEVVFVGVVWCGVSDVVGCRVLVCSVTVSTCVMWCWCCMVSWVWRSGLGKIFYHVWYVVVWSNVV